jgi:flagellar hook-length control protein FliK
MPKDTLVALPLPSILATDPAGESHSPISKLAAQAASSAESSQEIPVNAASNQLQETFSTVMERITNHSAAGFAHSPTTGTSALSPALELSVEIRLGQAAWRDEVGQKLTWMVSHNRQQADLVLNPPQLGRIEITLSLDGNQASASFTSPHAAVREALENSMTRLREILADAGVALGQTHVGSESRRDSNPMHSKNEGLVVMRQENDRHVAALDSPGAELTSRGIRTHSMVDIFA